MSDTTRSLRSKSWPMSRPPATRRRSKPCGSRPLGKQGSISALLKTLGAMAPEERKSQGPNESTD